MIIVLHPKYPKILILRYQQFTIKLKMVMIARDWVQKKLSETAKKLIYINVEADPNIGTGNTAIDGLTKKQI